MWRENQKMNEIRRMFIVRIVLPRTPLAAWHPDTGHWGSPGESVTWEVSREGVTRECHEHVGIMQRNGIRAEPFLLPIRLTCSLVLHRRWVLLPGWCQAIREDLVTSQSSPPASCNPDSAEINYQFSDRPRDTESLIYFTTAPHHSILSICFMATD